MNNIDELTAKLKAAAKLRIEADSWPGSDGRIARMGVYIETGDDISPANILTLIEALEAAEKRIAELEARELVVNLPAYVDGRTLGYGEVNHMIDLCVDAFERACHSAGINLTVEG